MVTIWPFLNVEKYIFLFVQKLALIISEVLAFLNIFGPRNPGILASFLFLINPPL
jgi:hypothetical protein